MFETPKAELQLYVEACAASIYRARVVLIVLITASVLTFVTTWNSSSESWLTERIDLDRNAMNLYAPADLPTEKTVSCESAGGLSSRIRLLPQDASGLSREDYEMAKERACFYDNSYLTAHLEQLLTLEAEKVYMVQVPFFGVAFDINDIGMFAGLTFSVVLLWFRFSLLRELNNIAIAFGTAGRVTLEPKKPGEKPGKGERQEEAKMVRELQRNRIRYCYDILAMQQVLTVPPPRARIKKLPPQKKWRVVFWRAVPKILYSLPFLVQLFVLKNDLASIHIGYALSPSNTLFITITEFVLLLIIAALTIVCITLSERIDKIWRDVDKELNRLKVPKEEA
jgi:hypothetical protein